MTRAVEEKQQKKDHILLPLRHSTTVCEIFKRKSVNDFIPILSLHIQLNRPLERETFIAYLLHSYRFLYVCACGFGKFMKRRMMKRREKEQKTLFVYDEEVL